MNKKQIFILVTFLLGVFMGAIDSGIVSPALTTLEQDFEIDYKWSVWVITIYTLVYAVSMPVISKLADIYGRKKVFMIGIFIFGLGSLLAGLATSFSMLLISRAIQAIGGGGIIPIANAFISQSFPKEKRGMALGLVGATFGVATIIAPNLGGFLVDNYNWQWIFFVNVPISVIVIIMATKIPNQVEGEKNKLDWIGSIFLSGVILALMYGLTNLETNNIVESLISWKVLPFIIVALILIFPFIWVEKRSEDSIIKLDYFKDKNIVLTLIISFITGVGLMSIIFIPAFSETLLSLSEGKGGYITTILAVASGIAAGAGGVLLDKWGSKKVVLLGFAFSLFGSISLAYFTNGWISLIIGLVIAGIGIGFTMGAPLNYIILELVPESDSVTALSLVSLFRSIGTTIGPVLLAGFISGAAANIPAAIQTDLNEEYGDVMTSFDISIGEDIEQSNFSIDEMLEMLPDQMPTSIKDQIIDVANNAVQQTLLSGYSDLYIASAFIFLIGILITILLRLPKRDMLK